MRVVLGLGLRESADLAGFNELSTRLCAPADCRVAVPEFRSHLPLIAVLRGLGRQITLIPRDALRGVPTISQSARSLATYGTGSVAEACALIACPGGAILQPPRRSFDNRLTGALAQAPSDAPIIDERPQP